MGFWRKLFGREGKSGESATTSLDLFREIYGGRESRAGVPVNWVTALETSTVLAICRVLADGVSQIPFRPYRVTPSGKSVATDIRLYDVITSRPNPWQSSFEFLETVMFHLVLTHNAYVYVNRVGTAREVAELIPLEPGRVTVKRNDDLSLDYRVRSERGAEKIFGADAIWHLRGPSWNSWMGLEATRLARNAIGLTIALEQGQADFQKNGAKTSGMYSVKEKLSPEKYDMLRAWFDEELTRTTGWRPLILDQDADYKPFTMTGVDQQLIETRKLQIEELCRAFRVWPIMVGHAGDQSPTFASAEQFFLAHVVHTLSPWYKRIETSANVNLLSAEERAAGLYMKFTPNALMRGAAKDRAEFYAKALGSGGSKGWMTQNEVRDFEEMDKSADPEADKLPQQIQKPQPKPKGSPERDDDEA